MKKRKSSLIPWMTFSVEFLSVFIAVISAFALNNWNEERMARNAESKILTEIYSGLEKDLEDLRINKIGHEVGLKSSSYFKKLVTQEEVAMDSFPFHYFNLTRDFISVLNTSGYEALKSKGLELIQSDSLRRKIISLYEYHYHLLRKFEEEYAEAQFHQSFFHEINTILAPHMTFSPSNQIIGVRLPLILSIAERNLILSYLWKIEVNRNFINNFYPQVEAEVEAVQYHIQAVLQSE